jgi:hypothetical protein
MAIIAGTVWIYKVFRFLASVESLLGKVIAPKIPAIATQIRKKRRNSKALFWANTDQNNPAAIKLL